MYTVVNTAAAEQQQQPQQEPGDTFYQLHKIIGTNCRAVLEQTPGGPDHVQPHTSTH